MRLLGAVNAMMHLKYLIAHTIPLIKVSFAINYVEKLAF